MTSTGSTRPCLRALWLTDKLGYGDQLHDVGQYYLATIPQLQRTSVRACVLRSTNGLADQLASRGVTVHRYGFGRFNPRLLGQLVREIRALRIGVLHLHGLEASMVGRVAGWLTRTPVIIHQHDCSDGLPWYVRAADRLLAPLAASVIASSTAVRDFCLRERALPMERILVWPPATPAPAAAEEDRASLRQRLNIPDGWSVVGTATRLVTRCSPRVLLEAIHRIVALRPQTVVLVLGTGPWRAALEEEAKRRGFADRLRMVSGIVELRQLLRVSDCALLHAVTEGTPVELLEAMAAGLPIVANHAAGSTTVLRHDVSGWLVPSANPRALADGVAHVLGDTALQQRLGRQARSAAGANDASWRAQQLEALYEELVTPARPRRPRRSRPLTTLVRYALVGASGGACHAGALWLLVERARWPVLAATTAGFLAAVLNNFTWNRRWTFRSADRNIRLQFSRFFAVSLVGLGWNNLSMAVLVWELRWPYLLAQLLTMPALWAWNFLANTYWTFHPKHPAPPAFETPKAALPLSIIIPAYNEEYRLPSTLAAIDRFLATWGERAEVIVVDDGSTDRTLTVATHAVLSAAALRLVHRARNQGKGAAMRAGLRAAQGEYCLMVDADNSIPIECVLQLWPHRRLDRIVIGSRYLRGRQRSAEVSRLRYWIGLWGNWLVRWMLLPEIRDSQCGFKLLSRPVAGLLAQRQQVRGFGFDMEWLSIATAMGLEIREVAVDWIQQPGSRVRPFRDAARVFTELLAIKSRLWSGYYDTHERLALPGGRP